MSKVQPGSVGLMAVSLLDLQGVETAYHHDDYLPRINPSEDMFGVIEWLCIAESNNCLTIPALQHLIEVGGLHYKPPPLSPQQTYDTTTPPNLSCNILSI